MSISSVDFNEATDRLAACPTHDEVADAAGWTSVQTVRQARLDPSSTGYRRPPSGWKSAIAKLAGARACELLDLARDLSGDNVGEVADVIGHGITSLEGRPGKLAPYPARQLAERLSRLAEELEG